MVIASGSLIECGNALLNEFWPNLPPVVRRLTSLTNEVSAAGLATHTAGKFFNCVEGHYGR